MTRPHRMILTTVVVAILNAPAVAGDNFRIVNRPQQQVAVYDRAAESAYARLSAWWFGRPHPDLWRPVPVTVSERPNTSGGGATTFVMNRGEVFGWKMQVTGTRQRILDDAIPHEVGHVVLYAHFRRPLGRCLDEGAAMIGESAREHAVYRRRVAAAIRGHRVIPFASALAMTQYPRDPKAAMAFYAQSHSLVEYLLQLKGRKTLVAFLADSRQPVDKLRDYYGQAPAELQVRWQRWFLERSGRGCDCGTFGCLYHAAGKPQRPYHRTIARQPVIYAFTANWCRACRPFERDVASGRFRDYQVIFIDAERDRTQWNTVTAQMVAETGHQGDVPLPSWWVPGSKKLVVMRGGYSGPGLLQILAAIVRGLGRILYNPDLVPDGTTPRQPGTFEGGASVPSGSPEAPAVEDWSGVTIAVLVAERHVGRLRGTARQALLGLSRGPLERKARELTGGKARLALVPERTRPQRYAAVLSAAGLEPRALTVVVLVPRQARGLLQGLIVKKVETVLEGRLQDKPTIEVLFERRHPADFAAVRAALAAPQSEPTRPDRDDSRDGRAVDPLRGLKQDVVFWLASLGLPMWLAERLTRNRRIKKQLETTWQRLRSSSVPSSPSSDSGDSAE